MKKLNAELKTTVVNMKTLTQVIPNPTVVVGASDAQGSKLRVIFTQEAAAQFTENTKVYLCWYHQELDIRGYNVFTEIKDIDKKNLPPTWEITYPKSMLYEGHVLANIQLVDDVSIAVSTNFIIHVLLDPNDGSDFVASDDYSAFQEAVINLTNLEGQVQDQLDEAIAQTAEQKAQMEQQRAEFENMQSVFDEIQSAVTALSWHPLS